MCVSGCGKFMDHQSVHLLEDVLTIWIKVCVSHLGEEKGEFAECSLGIGYNWWGFLGVSSPNKKKPGLTS